MTKGRPLGTDPNRGWRPTPMPTSGLGTKGFSFEDQFKDEVDAQSKATPPTTAPEHKVDLIALDLIDEPQVRTRWHYDQNRITAMRTSLLDHGNGTMLDGQLLPILVFQKDNGHFEIIEGLTRVKAFRQGAQSKTIKAIVLDRMSAAEAYHKSYAANEARDAMTDYDKGMSFGAALKAGIFKSQKEIAGKLSVSRALVTYILKFAQLHEQVHEVIEQDPAKFGANYAHELWMIQDKVSVDKAVTLAKKVLEGMSFSKLKASCAKLLQDQNPDLHKPRSGSIPTKHGKVKYNQHGVHVAYAPDKAMPVELAKEIAEIFAEASRRAEQRAKEFSAHEGSASSEQMED